MPRVHTLHPTFPHRWCWAVRLTILGLFLASLAVQAFYDIETVALAVGGGLTAGAVIFGSVRLIERRLGKLQSCSCRELVGYRLRPWVARLSVLGDILAPLATAGLLADNVQHLAGGIEHRWVSMLWLYTMLVFLISHALAVRTVTRTAHGAQEAAKA